MLGRAEYMPTLSILALVMSAERKGKELILILQRITRITDYQKYVKPHSSIYKTK